MPASCHARSCAHAWSSTQSPIGRIKPLRSAIEALGANGDGVANHAGDRLFVPWTLPGEHVRVRRDAGQRDLARASLERYLQTYPEARLPKDVRPLLDD